MINCKSTGFERAKQRIAQMAARYQSEEPSQSIIDVLRGECNALIADARSLGAYTDRTGNLRSSIGAAIYYNGREVEILTPTQGTQTGRERAAAAVQAWAISHPERITQSGYTIIIVAGMNYGRYVEAKGFNVLNLTISKGEKDVAEIAKKIRALRVK
jgi:hypothetical protein